ncbi:TPA: TrbM/KikA/MpfK family conjugal transfer protein [Pseudomonas aeruginosa]
MKRSTVITALLASMALVGTAEARDPCKTMMCMAGQAGLMGSSLEESDCSGAISDFFAIVVKKNGKFKPEATSQAREEFLNSCPGSEKNQGTITPIISMFGMAN